MSDSEKRVLKGSCLCGAVRYKVRNIGRHMGHCHCSMCRKFHGAAFATFGETEKENFSWEAGEDKIRSYTAVNGTVRRFCGECGSSLTFAPNANDNVLVEFTLGTLDDDLELRPDAHIFTAYKASWFEISDDLPKFDDGRK